MIPFGSWLRPSRPENLRHAAGGLGAGGDLPCVVVPLQERNLLAHLSQADRE